MISQERPDIASSYIQKIRELVTGSRVMPEVNYGGRDNDVVHLSDVTDGTCLAQAFYRISSLRNKVAIPEISDTSALYFLRGRISERSISEEMEPKFCEGITFTLDGYNAAYNLFVEIKSTAMGQTNFEPEEAPKAWLSRLKGYCYALGVKEIALVVIFICGDAASWKKPKDGIKKKIGLRAWVITFDDTEIEENWTLILCNKVEIEGALTGDRPLDPLMVTPQSYECASCVYQSQCQYYSGKA